MTKMIPLSQGKVALVDDADYEWLSQWKWYYNNGYAVRKISTGSRPRQRKIFMHRLILNPPLEMQTDHQNGDGLDNRRSNLRPCTNSQQQMNTKKSSGCSSKYKGVSWNKKHRRWYVHIKVGDNLQYLGHFADEEQAALTYNAAALEHFGAFARLNDIEEPA